MKRKGWGLSLALALGPSGAASAHDLAEWINEGDYRGPGGIQCCGPHDCGIIHPTAARVRSDGSVEVMLPDGQSWVVLPEGVHWSKDLDYWACARRCLFMPGLAAR
jgi:hypothetical protein